MAGFLTAPETARVKSNAIILDGYTEVLVAIAHLTLATVTIAGLLIRTIVGVARGELRDLST